MIRSVYAVLPISVYNGNATVPSRQDPFDGTDRPIHQIYSASRGGQKTFAQQFPDARKSVDGTKVIISDSNWGEIDLDALRHLISTAGFPRYNSTGGFEYGVLQYHAALELMATVEWTIPEG